MLVLPSSKKSLKIDLEVLYRSLGLNFKDEQAKYIKQKRAELNSVFISELSTCAGIIGFVILIETFVKNMQIKQKAQRKQISQNKTT